MNTKQNTVFIFDLDGTVTAQETLPVIAQHFGVADEMRLLTQETIHGNIPFVESFIHRVHMLGALPVSSINALLTDILLHPKVLAFIAAHQEQCVVATGNLRCWITGLTEKIGCTCHSSDATIENDRVVKLTTILRKEDVVEQYRREGYRVVFVGDGNNDMEAMRVADIAIASGLTHQPAQSVLTVADYLTYSEEALCRQLNQLS